MTAIHRARNGRFYKIMANGRARFISNAEARRHGKVAPKPKKTKAGKLKKRRMIGGAWYDSIADVGKSIFNTAKSLAPYASMAAAAL